MKPAPRPWATGVGFIALALAVCCLALASHTRGEPTASLLLDPWGDYSAVSLPSWEPVPLVSHTRVIAVNGIATGGHDAVDALDAALQENATVELTFDVDGSAVRLTRSTEPIGIVALWWFSLSYIALGLLFVTTGLVALRVAAPDAARAYFFLSLSSAVFLFTFYDYHSTRLLVPLFSAATMGLPFALIVVALRFPAPWAPRAAALMFRCGLALSLVAFTLALLRIDARPMRMAVSGAIPLALAFTAVVGIVRFKRADASTRLKLRPVLFALGVTPALAAMSGIAITTGALPQLHLLLPFLAFIVPGALAWALIRHSVALGTERLPLWLAQGAAAATALAVFLVVTGIGLDAFSTVTPAFVVGGLAGVATAFAGMFVVERTRTTRRALSPSLSQLVAKLETVHSAADVMAVTQAACSRLLPDVAVTLSTVAPAEDEAASPRALKLVAGGRVVGVLRYSERSSGVALFDDEVAALETLAAIAALALASVERLEKVEERSTQITQLDRDDRRLAIDLLAAEIAHEIAYPLTYFRFTWRRLQGGNALSAEDLNVGAEEVARLERMVGVLRKRQLPAAVLRPVPLRAVVERVFSLLEPELLERALSATVTGDDVVVMGEEDGYTQVLLNLLRNAAHAAQKQVGVELSVQDGAACLKVWDDGDGVAPDDVEKLFSPWFTTKGDRGTGLGLAICQRILRNAGAEIRYSPGPPSSMIVTAALAHEAARPRGEHP